MINPKTGDEFWYYNTTKEHLDVIVQGIKCFTVGGNVSFRTPWVLLSQSPDTNKVPFVVDISGIKLYEWSYTEDKNGDRLLRIYQDIEPFRIKPYVS